MKLYDYLVGILVFLGISTVITYPAVSIPKDNGATSINNKSLVFSPPVSVNIAA